LPIPVSVKVTDSENVSSVQLLFEREGYAWPSTVDMELTNGTLANGTWSGTIPAQEWGGTLTFRIIANDGITRYPVEGSQSIEIDGPSESTFPWKWLIIGLFLVVVFIATELAFKPGVWRPTGRQRARALEEEDRRKELEELERRKEQEEEFQDHD